MTPEVGTKATTIASDDGRAMAIVLVFCGAVTAVVPLFDRAHWWVWAKHIPLLAAVVADLAVFAIASVWVLYWGFRLGVRFADDGVTVRRTVKMDRYAWREVSRFADGCYKTGHGGTIWALDVVLVDGRAVTLTATARKEMASPKMLTAIGEVAARYQIPAELTGTPQTRDGSLGQSLALSRAIGTQWARRLWSRPTVGTPTPWSSSQSRELRITRAFSCVARGFKARLNLMFAGCW